MSSRKGSADSSSQNPSYDARLADLPPEHKQRLLGIVKDSIERRFAADLNARNGQSTAINGVSVPIPPEDAPALAEYRSRHNLTNKDPDGKAKVIRCTLEYWQIIADRREAVLEEVVPETLWEMFPQALPAVKEQLELRQAEEQLSRRKFEEELAAAATIDEAMAVARKRELSFGTRDADAIEEAVAEIIEEDRHNRYSSSQEVRQALADCEEAVLDMLSDGDLSEYHYQNDFSAGWGRYRKSYVVIPIKSVEDLVEMVAAPYGYEDDLVSKMVSWCDAWEEPYAPVVVTSEKFNDAFTSNPEVAALIGLAEELGGDWWDIRDALDCSLDDWETDFRHELQGAFPDEKVLSLIRSNPLYAPLFAEAEKMEEELLSRIPDDPADAYPKARGLTRRFVLHVGPTNSGKTHDAIEALAAASTGVYLAPLRLLAFEQYEALNARGCDCALLTGEESRGDAGCPRVSSTIEMLDFSREYDVAVIDEAQMMAEPDRGHRWTAAILGVAAHEVHVCMSSDALPLVEQLVEHCGDSHVLVEHERKTPLVPHQGGYGFPGSVAAGDAIVVFSRRAVHAVASELEGRGMKVSMIYGSLPYDVRHAQAERFASGETDVVVATDAIGMGMNLPIKRVVFLEQAKFDGHERRFLKASEVQQIAGRAGRYGIYDEGLFASVGESKKIRMLMGQPLPIQESAPLGFASSLLGVPGRVSSLMSKWVSLTVDEPFAKNNMEHEIELAGELEAGLGVEESSQMDKKRLVYRFATMPFKDNIPELKATWTEMFALENRGVRYPVSVPEGALPQDMMRLEDEYALLDLLFQYCRVFGYSEHYDAIQKRRDGISAKMMELLGRKGVFEPRKCRECGKKMAWNYPYPMCQKCHDRL